MAFCAMKQSLKELSPRPPPPSLQSLSIHWGQINWLREALGGQRCTGDAACSPGAYSHVRKTEPEPNKPSASAMNVALGEAGEERSERAGRKTLLVQEWQCECGTEGARSS